MSEEQADERRCRAKSKRSGERCRRFPIPGGVVCHIHGGAAPAARAKARERMVVAAARADAERLLTYEAVDRMTDPLEALGRLAVEALAMKEALASRVNALASLRYSAAGAGTEQLRAEVALYERALDRSAKFLDMLARNNFEERRIQLSEAQGQQLAAVIRAVLERLLLTSEQQELVPVVVPEELRRVISSWRQPETIRGELG
jgi:hypothetical protein